MSVRSSVCLVAALALGVLTCGITPAYGAWQLVWSDEFAQPDGSSPDSTKWGYDIGNGSGGWGNNEKEYYTSRTSNARIQGGQLVIEADKESYGGQNYTSARMLTKGKWSWAYGRMEASIKLPRGQGIWPAFWMLGTNVDSAGWPTCGEVDIMENIGNTNDQAHAHGTIHGPQNGGDYNGNEGVGGTYTLPGGGALADAFHLYAVEWTTNQIKWYVDSTLYFTATPSSLPSGGIWVFTAPQFLILNLAVGGNWPGNPDATTVFPQQMLVDYVHVYKYVASPPDPPTSLKASPGNGMVFLSWNASTNAVTGYNVKRSTVSGGSYTTIATVTTNNYTDTAANCSSFYYVVSATNSLGESTNSSEASAALGSYALAVNSGGSATGQFVADAYVSGGGTSSSTPTVDTSAVTAPAPQGVYQSERHGNFTYTFTGLTSGLSYKVRLHFAETYWSGVGKRIFNVFINGTQVLTNFDIFAVAGVANKATIQEFMVTPSAGQIAIQYVTVTDNAKSSGIEILLPQSASPLAANNGPVCAGSTINLTASTVTGATYNWIGPNGFSSNVQNPAIASATTNASGSYSVTATVGGCASPATTTTVTVNALPATPVAGNNGPICAGSTLNLTASTVPGATYSWTGPNGFTSNMQNPAIANATTSASGSYSVIATANGCVSAAGTTTVTVNSLPASPTAGNNGPVCAGSALNLTASTVPGATYSWTGPNGFSSSMQNPAIANANTNASGTYSVTAMVGGCASPAAMTSVSINPLPNSPAASNNGPVNQGATLNLWASTLPGATYSWTGPNGFTATNQNPSIAAVTTNAAGTYLVTASVANCSSAPAATSVTVNPGLLLAIQLSGTNLTITWPNGTLQSATNATGPWADVPGASMPYTNTADQPQQFYRVAVPQ
jgi:beta-glucanase (GH16 family)